MVTYIYMLFDPREPDTIRYVGKTTNIAKRMHAHKSEARKGSSRYVCRWVNKLLNDGVDFSYVIIDQCIEDWEASEQYWIKYYRELGHPLTNLTDGGEGACGHHHTDETKQRISEKMHEIQAGVPKSEAHKRKLSEAKRGKKQTPESVQKRKESRQGYQHSEETIEKIREWHIGFTHSDEAKEKMSQSRLGVSQPNRKVGASGYRYVYKSGNKYRIEVHFCKTIYRKAGFLTAEDASIYAQSLLEELLDVLHD